MNIQSIKGVNLGQTSYLLIENGHALLVDCGFDISDLKRYLSGKDIVIDGVLLTHGHFDHAYCGAELLRQGVHIYSSVHSEELTSGRYNLARFLNVPFEKFASDCKINGDCHFLLSEFDVEVFYTPGHSIDSMCYLINGVLFSGDTLLSGAYGRVDLPTGDATAMRTSLKKLLSFDKKLPVCSGHESVRKGVNPYLPNRAIGDYCCSQDIIYFLSRND